MVQMFGPHLGDQRSFWLQVLARPNLVAAATGAVNQQMEDLFLPASPSLPVFQINLKKKNKTNVTYNNVQYILAQRLIQILHFKM